MEAKLSGELPIEDIHRLLETIDQIKSDPQLSGGKGNRALDVGTLPDLSMVVLEVLGWTNTAYMENKLGIDPSVLSKFVKMRGKVHVQLRAPWRNDCVPTFEAKIRRSCSANDLQGIRN